MLALQARVLSVQLLNRLLIHLLLPLQITRLGRQLLVDVDKLVELVSSLLEVCLDLLDLAIIGGGCGVVLGLAFVDSSLCCASDRRQLGLKQLALLGLLGEGGLYCF
jgi:hypothetical protein